MRKLYLKTGFLIPALLPVLRLFLLPLSLFLFFSVQVDAQNSSQPAEPRPLRVLMLFGELRDTPGGLALEQGVRAELQNAVTNRIEFLMENLDVVHYWDEAHFKLFQDYVGKKYAGQKLDLVLAFPSRDYRLAGALPDALFPDVPVVFAAVNEMDVPQDIQKLGVTGIVQRFDLRGTLGLILRLQPDVRHVLVVGGSTAVDRATLSRIEELARSSEEISFTFFTNRPIAELPAIAQTLSRDTVILLSPVQQDVTGQHYFMSQLAEMLAPQAHVPVYVLGGWAIGSGAVGGVVVNTDDLARRTAKIAQRVLAGAAPESVPIEVEAQGTPMLDWRALNRWSIPESRVPTDGIVRYRPVTLWDEHRGLILFSLAIFLAQTFTIAGLFVQRKYRQRAEREVMRQQTELAHVNRVATMGQLASALAHELTQPLGAILRNTEAAEIELQQKSPDYTEVRDILADIRKDDQRAGNVIERMRSLLKRRQLELKPLELDALLAETVTLAESDADVRGVELTLQIREKLPVVLGDRVHLQQVLLNLILNGMDAMAEEPAMERKLIVRTGSAKNGTVEVAVIDWGPGIPAGNLPRLFEPFFTTKSNGMGMGLAISQTIIEAHGGKIWAENIDPRGAVFKFTLPVKNTGA